MAHRARLSTHDYTVGWIAALHVELAAATVMLDEEHDLPHDFQPDASDENFYTFGRVGPHNVILTCLSAGKYGTISAAVTTTRLVMRFPALRVGLMVGIGGGVPSESVDIRLGDIAIGIPNGQHPGVVQYDLGKRLPSGFQRTGNLNSPPRLLLNAISYLRARDQLGQSSLLEHLSIFKHIPKDPFSRENAGEDTLYDENERPVPRAQRATEEPLCHYGTIASGDIVMKSGSLRDSISRDLGGVICFEMEAAGIMDNFPCLVIRGICDYSDAHKHDLWQPYAAATAAAYAKSLLKIIPGSNLDQVETISEALDKYSSDVSRTGGSEGMVKNDRKKEKELDGYGGPRRGERGKGVRGVIKETEPSEPSEPEEAVDFEALEDPSPEQKAEQKSRILQRIKETSNPRQGGFILFNRTYKYYTEIYSGNGSVMRSIINNQAGTIRNTNGPMNFGTVGGSMRSGNAVVRGSRGYMTRAYKKVPSVQSVRRALFLTPLGWLKGLRRT
ncbi:kinesin light chain [Sarocladium implicatum]|nr:kinesin light chain [Sarocladium implicatum]